MTRKVINLIVMCVIYCQVLPVISIDSNKHEKHKRDVTFVELEGFMSGIIKNKVYFGGNHLCSSDCKNLYHKADDNLIGNDFICTGVVNSCTQLKSDSCKKPLSVCTSDGTKHYAWINDIDEEYRARGRCTNVKKAGVECPNFPRECNNCLCVCTADNDFKSSSVRSFSLGEQLSDIHNNMIVTGLKIVKKNKMIHLQIQEAKLAAHKKIISDTKSWQPLGVIEELSKYSPYPSEWSQLISDENYISLTFDQRTINLDEIILPKDYVLTGIKFGVTVATDNSHKLALRIEIQGTKIIAETGEILTNTSKWFTSDYMESCKSRADYLRKRTELPLYDCDDPLYATNNSFITETNKFVKIRNSDMKKDLGQSTIPYFDIRTIEVDDVPIIGVSLTHMGQKGYGGFITLRAFPSLGSMKKFSVLTTEKPVRTTISPIVSRFGFSNDGTTLMPEHQVTKKNIISVNTTLPDANKINANKRNANKINLLTEVSSTGALLSNSATTLNLEIFRLITIFLSITLFFR